MECKLNLEFFLCPSWDKGPGDQGENIKLDLEVCIADDFGEVRSFNIKVLVGEFSWWYFTLIGACWFNHALKFASDDYFDHLSS